MNSGVILMQKDYQNELGVVWSMWGKAVSKNIITSKRKVMIILV
jgi:hypothetical protein